MAYSPDGKCIASGSSDKTVRIWNLKSGDCHVLEGHTGWVRSVAFSSAGRHLASSAFDRTVRIWDLESGECHVLEGHTGWVKSIAYSPDGKYLASSAYGRTVRIWETKEFQEVGKYTIIPHLNLNGANFELSFVDKKDKEILRATGAKADEIDQTIL